MLRDQRLAVIRGENLLADSSVLIENKSIGSIIGSADATKLTIRNLPSVDVPGGLPEAGKRVQLLVINDVGNAATEFVLKPEKLNRRSEYSHNSV